MVVISCSGCANEWHNGRHRRHGSTINACPFLTCGSGWEFTKTDLEFTETQRGKGEAGGRSEKNPSLHSQTVTDQRAGTIIRIMAGGQRYRSCTVNTKHCRRMAWWRRAGDCALRPCCPRGHWTSRFRATCVFDMLFLEKEGISPAVYYDYSTLILHELQVDKTRLLSAYCLVILFPNLTTSTKAAPSKLLLFGGGYSRASNFKNIYIYMSGPFFVLMGRQVALINTSTFHGGHPSSPAQQ